ncbi:MAG: uroporphyrinogen decarboxylase family protein [Candidatus Asgardarchaeia archaeon]
MEMNPYERVMTALKLKEPDIVPVFALAETSASKLVNTSLLEYFKNPEKVAEGQLKFYEKINHDFLTSFYYLAKDAEAFGSESIFFENGPPNVGKLLVKSIDELLELEVPDPQQSEKLKLILETTKILANEKKNEVPIVGVVTGPFSLPVLLMGMEKWLESILLYPEKIPDALKIMSDFVYSWANLQLDAGNDAIVLVDGASTRNIIPEDIFLQYAKPILKRVIKRIKGPVLLSGAGGSFQDFRSHLPDIGVKGVIVSTDDDLGILKKDIGSKIALLGNINNIAIQDWDEDKIREEVKKCIDAAASGGGFVLMNQHSFPWTVSLKQIEWMVRAAREFGVYGEKHDS